MNIPGPPPPAIRQIGGHKWNYGVDSLLENEINDIVVCWFETGWVFSIHLLSDEIDTNNGDRVVTVSQDVYKLDVSPEKIENILEYIVSEESNRFKKASDVCVYIK